MKLLIHSQTLLKFGNGISNFIQHFIMDVITQCVALPISPNMDVLFNCFHLALWSITTLICTVCLIALDSKLCYIFTGSGASVSSQALLSLNSCHSVQCTMCTQCNSTLMDTNTKLIRGHLGYGLSQWEQALLCNTFSHWLSPYPEWSFHISNLTVCSLLSACAVYT